MLWTDFARRGIPWVALAGAQPAGVDRPQLRLAPPPECGGLRRRARVRRSRHGPARARRHGRPARAQPGLLPAPPAPARPRAGRARGGAARVAPPGRRWPPSRWASPPRRSCGRRRPASRGRSSSPPPPAAARWSREQPVRSRSRRLRAPRRGRLRAGAGAGRPASGSWRWPTPIRPAAPSVAGLATATGVGPANGDAVLTFPDATSLLAGAAVDGVVLATPAARPPGRRRAGGGRRHTHARGEAAGAGRGRRRRPGRHLDPPPWVGFNRRFDPGAAAVRAAVGRRRRRRPAPRDRLPPVGLGRAPRPRRRPPRPRPPPVDWARWITGADVVDVACAECTPDRAALDLTLGRGRATLRAATDRPHAELVELRDGRGDVVARHRLGGLAAAVRGRLGRSGPTTLVTTLAAPARGVRPGGGREPDTDARHRRRRARSHGRRRRRPGQRRRRRPPNPHHLRGSALMLAILQFDAASASLIDKTAVRRSAADADRAARARRVARARRAGHAVRGGRPAHALQRGRAG